MDFKVLERGYEMTDVNNYGDEWSLFLKMKWIILFLKSYPLKGISDHMSKYQFEKQFG